MSIIRRFAGVLALAPVVILSTSAVRPAPQSAPRDDVFAADGRWRVVFDRGCPPCR